MPVQYVEITERRRRQLPKHGHLFDEVAARMHQAAVPRLMEAQVGVEISGGIGEAIYLGKSEAWRSH